MSGIDLKTMEIYCQKGYSLMPLFPMSPEKDHGRHSDEIFVAQTLGEMLAASGKERLRLAQEYRIRFLRLFPRQDLYVRFQPTPTEEKLRLLIAGELGEQVFTKDEINAVLEFPNNDLVQGENGIGVKTEDDDDEPDEIWLTEELKKWRGE